MDFSVPCTRNLEYGSVGAPHAVPGTRNEKPQARHQNISPQRRKGRKEKKEHLATKDTNEKKNFEGAHACSELCRRGGAPKAKKQSATEDTEKDRALSH